MPFQREKQRNILKRDLVQVSFFYGSYMIFSTKNRVSLMF